MKENPGHLGAMNVPDGHISVDCFHILWHYAHRPIISEGFVLPVDVVEESWRLEGAVYGCVDLGLVVIGDGGDLEAIELGFPCGFGLGLDLVEHLAAYFSDEIEPCVTYADVGYPNVYL